MGLIEDLKKGLAKITEVDARKGQFRSCEGCSFFKKGYCTQVQPPSRILNVYEAQLCIYYTPETATTGALTLTERATQRSILDKIKVIDEVTLLKTLEIIDLVGHITSIGSLGTLNLVNTISQITNIANVQSIDLIDLITKISEITEIKKVRGLHWYDRNPDAKADHWGVTGGPHPLTTRLTYTVPANKLAMVEILSAKVERITPAESVDLAMALWQLDDKYVIRSNIYGNVAGDKDLVGLGTSLMLCANDSLLGRTYDGSTGGTCNYFLSLKVTEFDV